MPRATLTLKGFEGAGTFGFANADGSQNYIGIDATGNVSFLKKTTHNGASTFSAGVTMGQTLTVTGTTTLNGNLVLNPLNGGPTISANGGTVSWIQQGNPLTFQIQDTNAQFGFAGSSSSANVDIQKPNAFTLTATSLMNKGECDAYYIQKDETITLNNLNVNSALNANNSLAVKGASTFTGGVTMAQTLTVAGNTTINGNITAVKTLCLNSSSGVSSIYFSGAYTAAGEIYTLSFDDGDGSPFMSWAYNRLAKRIDITPLSGVSLSLPVLQSLSVDGAVLVGSLQLGPNDIKYDGTDVTATGNWTFGRTTFTGGMTVNAGATFAQAITVAGVLMATGGVTIPNKNLYLGPNIRFVAESGNALELKMDSADGSFTVPSLAVAAPTSTTSGALSVGGPATFAQTLSVTGNTTLNGNILMGPVTISRSANMLNFSSPVTFQGAMTFNAGVTMAQTLTVTGHINSNSLLNIADGTGIQFGTSINMYSTGADFWLEGPANGKVGLNLPIEFPGPAEGTTLTDNMGVNVAMGDARYAKIVTTTKAAYTALATKDPTTIYLITDTTPRMWAIGDMEIVTADVPA